MIIRSGLIRNRDGIDFGTFTEHWRNVHAPLVVKIDGLRAYSQNHVHERLPSNSGSGLHRVDGISQLYFDDIEAMKISMASQEQQACIIDLRGFLSDVTLLIQEAGDFNTFGPATLPIKLLYLLHCNQSDVQELAGRIGSVMGEADASWKFRINPIIARDVVVDHTISAGEQVVDLVMEVWVENKSDAQAAAALVKESSQIGVVAGFEVEEVVVLPQQ
ncbi:EthD family reductase [Agrobacterium sp. MCAB5]|uniref:EthD family reductase n=1 Tax=Agrobacterium sp. MCAB5 TaxID=3233042 RepID=UPI003F92E6F0